MVGHASTDGTMMDGLGFGFCSSWIAVLSACVSLSTIATAAVGIRPVSRRTQAAREPSPQGGEMLPTALFETRVQCGGGTPANAFSTAIPSPDVYRLSSACQTQPAAVQVPNRPVVHSPHPWLQASAKLAPTVVVPSAGCRHNGSRASGARGQSLLSRRRGRGRGRGRKGAAMTFKLLSGRWSTPQRLGRCPEWTT